MSPDPLRYRPLAAMPLAAAYVDAEGGVLVENDWFRALRSTCSPGAATADRFMLPMLFVEEDRDVVSGMLAAYRRAPQRLSRALTAAGSLAPLLAEFTPIRRRSGRDRFWFVTLRPSRQGDGPPLDLSSRAAATAGIVHDLRAPVQVVLGWASVLRRRQGDPAQLEHALTFIERSAGLLGALLEDLLEQTRPPWSRKPERRQDVDLAGIVAAEVQAVQPLAEDRGIHMSVAVEASPTAVRGDDLQLRRVVINLIGNAVQFTPPRGLVSCRLWRSGGWVGFAVSDTGPGIAREFLARVFDPFVREPGRRLRRRGGGAGLGLAIVRHLVEQHGGTVTAASRGSGGGATLTVLLPAAPSSITDRGDDAPARQTLRGGRRRKARQVPRAAAGIDDVEVCRRNRTPDPTAA